MIPRRGNNPFGLRPDRDALREIEQARRDEQHNTARTCGTWINGIRCGEPLKTGRPVCGPCSRYIAQELFRSGEGRRWMTELLGHDQVESVAHAERIHLERRKAQHAAERRVARNATSATAVVYYVRTGQHQVKIGTTARLPERLRELRTVNLGNLLAVEPGGYDLERQRHDQFRAWRYNPRTEDFWDAVELIDHTRAIVEQYGDPKGFLFPTAEET